MAAVNSRLPSECPGTRSRAANHGCIPAVRLANTARNAGGQVWRSSGLSTRTGSRSSAMVGARGPKRCRKTPRTILANGPTAP
ncbi:MAG: hypothetical protein BWX54_00663 [Verrucomicrobia bacterium ADurb.Bin018]|nr:MAG: hypothetical protein BWX54_00663 [Verrucomicrobia bacterium ADurb.Bin018]